jgi:5'(3')-deoxyribonucleotidase
MVYAVFQYLGLLEMDRKEYIRDYLKIGAMKKIIYFDMDGVLVDLGKEIDKRLQDLNLDPLYREEPDLIEDLFKNPDPIEGAIEAVHLLKDSGKYELYIATSAPWGNPIILMHKRLWIEAHFGEIFHKKLFVTHCKNLLMGDFLIDDRTENGAKDFKGELIQFGVHYKSKEPNPYPTWDSVLNRLL